ALNRLTREGGFDGLTWGHDYDPAAQLVARVDPAPRVTRFIRDLRGLVIEKRPPDGTPVNFVYVSVSRITQADPPPTQFKVTYDPVGKSISDSQYGNATE